MKKLIALLFMLVTIQSLGQNMPVMTFNIRYDNPNDGADRWQMRKQDVAQLINHYEPVVLGVQEAILGQVQYLDSSLTRYNYIGLGRDDGKEAGEFSAIFFDTTRVKLVDEGTFWLSTTPEEVSVGWDAALPRICTYGLFRAIESDKVFWVFNTHFDHVGEQARLNSAALIVRKMQSFNIGANPILLMGDLNSLPDQAPIKLLNNNAKDARHQSLKTYGPEGTFFGFDLEASPLDRIDYIFGKNLNFISYRVIDDRRTNNRHVSDHLPVLALVGFN